jgi:hypothetical protein
MKRRRLRTRYIPSSGVMVKVKLRRSAGSAKCVFRVDGKSNSVKSRVTRKKEAKSAISETIHDEEREQYLSAL